MRTREVTNAHPQTKQHSRRWGLLVWGLLFLAWALLYAALGGEGNAEASTLGWTTVITSIFAEVRNIGFVCFGGALTIAGIDLFFRRHLDALGQTMACISVGGALVGAGAGAVVLLGNAAGTPLAPMLHLVQSGEAMGDLLGLLLWHGTLGAMSAYWWTRRNYDPR